MTPEQSDVVVRGICHVVIAIVLNHPRIRAASVQYWIRVRVTGAVGVLTCRKAHEKKNYSPKRTHTHLYDCGEEGEVDSKQKSTATYLGCT